MTIQRSSMRRSSRRTNLWTKEPKSRPTSNCCTAVTRGPSSSMTVHAVLTTIAMTLTLGGVNAQQSTGPSPEQAYRNRFMVAGFFLRAGEVCEADGRRLIEAAFDFLGSEEIKAVSKAFPNATEKWMTEGADGFNSTVLKDGIRPACASAVTRLQQIQVTDERLRSSSSPGAQPPNLRSAARPADAGVDRCKIIRRQHFEKWTSETQKEYRENCWQLVEADNGAAFKIDLGLIQEIGGEATTAIYSDEGTSFNPVNLRRWFFTCRGHFRMQLENGRLSPMSYAPPRSVAAQMSNIVCAGAGIGQQGN